MYRRAVTSALVALFALAGARSVEAQKLDADLAEINRYRLTEAKLNKFVQATKNLAQVAKTHPEISKEDKADTKNMTLGQMAAFYDKHPPIKRAINAAGMTSREYVTFMLSMFQAGMMAWAAKQPGAKIPPEVSRENIAFMDTHKDRLDALQKEFEAMEGKKSSSDDDSSDEEEEEEEEAESDSTPAMR